MMPQKIKFTATAPSNIAFIKYWGKRDASLQWPANDSLSMTLSNCVTVTTARRTEKMFDSFTFENRTLTSDELPAHKVFQHINRIRSAMSIRSSLEIVSHNNFPTASGIASSASGYAALTLATVSALLDDHNWSTLNAKGMSRLQLANLARLGSGSACRSLFGGFVKWSANQDPGSQVIHDEFSSDHWDLSDVIVVLSSGEKHTSSSEAHLAAWTSPLFDVRLAGIESRLSHALNAISTRQIEKLGDIIEIEALEMHAVAMSGRPAIHYFTKDTSEFIGWVRRSRNIGSLPAWFTIDAGPNVHLICESKDVATIVAKIKSDWPNAKLILDRVGNGPTIQIEGTETAK